MSSLIESSIIGPAMLCGLLVLLTHVPLGRQVIRRGIIFLDLAVAQVAALVVLAAEVDKCIDANSAIQVTVEVNQGQTFVDHNTSFPNYRARRDQETAEFRSDTHWGLERTSDKYYILDSLSESSQS